MKNSKYCFLFISRIETGVDPWVDNLWPALFKQLGLDFQTISFVDCYNIQNSVRSASINEMEPVPVSTKLEKSDITDLPSLMKGIDLQNCHIAKLPLPLYTVVYNKQCVSFVFHSLLILNLFFKLYGYC